eukprot:m.462966 g.462966  ORF g.462966 m.462966 type:complete len:365 (-) comp21606_c0_seq3:1128-2222(-)
MGDKNPDTVQLCQRRQWNTSISEPNSESSFRCQVAVDLMAVDFIFSLFVTAAKSYRRNSLVRPFPTRFRNEDADEINDFERLLKCIGSIRPLKYYAQTPVADSALSPDAEHLLEWLLKRCPLRVESCSAMKYMEIQEQTSPNTSIVHPDYVFEVVRKNEIDNGKRTNSFEELRERYGSMIAYHGTALENFHSILFNGFLSHLNKTALFGSGTYLSSDLSVCMGFTRSATAWEHSQMGSQMSCVAVCEVIKHPDVTLPGERLPCADLDQSTTLGGDKAPDTYVVVPNNDHIRPRYMLVYVDRKCSSTGSRTPGNRLCSSVTHFIARHRFALIMLGYMVVLCLIGLWQNSRYFRKSVLKYVAMVIP